MNSVSVIIVNYNTFKLTSECIRSLVRHTRGSQYEILLVDNASTECDPERFKDEFPQVQLIRSESNGGFAYGNNLGISSASGDHFLLLNSDTILEEDSISTCMEYLSNHPKVGVLGCRMVFPDKTIQYTARRFRSIRWELLDLFRFIPYLIPYRRRSKLMLGRYFRHDENIVADWVNGAFFLIPRKVINQLPGQKLDDRFFMYGEDQLWCEQIKKLSLAIMFYAGTTIIHYNSGSTEKSKQLFNRKIMMNHELQIMRIRKGRGLYYFFFKLIFMCKERTRSLVKAIVYGLSGRMVR